MGRSTNQRRINMVAVPRGIRNNNPGNLKHVVSNNWVGLTGSDNTGFCVFSRMSFGIRAMAIDILGDWKEGKKSVDALIREYSPDDRVNNYIRFVSSRLGVHRHEALDLTHIALVRRLIVAMIKFENGAKQEWISIADLESGVHQAMEHVGLMDSTGHRAPSGKGTLAI